MASQVFVVMHKSKKGANALAEVHDSRDDADEAAAELSDATVVAMEIGARAPASKPKATKKPKAKKTEDSDIDQDENEPNEKIPDGKPGALAGLKLLFTGTHSTMDRKACKATVERYGGKVVTNLNNTDYIIVSAKAGQNKLEEIAEKDLATLTEAQFLQLLKTGPSDEKRQELADRAEQEPPKKKAKK